MNFGIFGYRLLTSVLLLTTSLAHAQSAISEDVFLNELILEKLKEESKNSQSGLKSQKSDTKSRNINSLQAYEVNSQGDVKNNKIQGNIPNGLSNKKLPPWCDLKKFNETLLKQSFTSHEYAKIILSYLKGCEKELTGESRTGLLGLLEFSGYDYSFFKHKNVTLRNFKLPSGVNIPAIVAIKDDLKPRPMIIVRCGVFCGAEVSASTKGYMMSLFDQSPFNIIILANHTSADYVKGNNLVSMGGLAEGKESFEFGQWLKFQSSYANIISSLHFAGISLGGNAAMFGAYYNDIFPDVQGNRVFNSVSAICPVVSLKPTLDKLFGGMIVGRIMNSVTREHFLSLKPHLQDVGDLVTEKNVPKDRKAMPGYMGYIMATSLTRRGSLTNTDSYFKSNNFWNLHKTIETPLLAFASEDDFIVDYSVNTKVLKENDIYEKNESTAVLAMKYGSHCGFASAYGLEFTSLVLRNFILNNSPEFKPEYIQTKQLDWKGQPLKISNTSVHVEQSWVFTPKSEIAKVEFTTFEKGNSQKCNYENYWIKKKDCTKISAIDVPIREIASLGGYVPTNFAEAQALTREFNAKIEFVTDSGPINGTNTSSFSLKYFEY